MTIESSSTVEIPTSFADPPAATPPAPSFMDMVPTEFREKAFVQDVAKSDKPMNSLFSMFENAQSMLGKKTAGVEIPGENAPLEAVSAFRKALGVPDSADAYSYKAPDLSKEPEALQSLFKQTAENGEFLKNMRAEAHKAGLSDKQFNALASAFDSQNLQQAKSMLEAAQNKGSAQREKFSKFYGDKAEHVERVSKEIAAKVIPDEIKAMGDPEMCLFALCNYINEKVFSNDKIGTPTGAPTETMEDLRRQIDAERAKPGFDNPMARDYEDIQTRIQGLYKRAYGRKEE